MEQRPVKAGERVECGPNMAAELIGRRHPIAPSARWQHESDDEEQTEDSLSSADEREPLHHSAETPSNATTNSAAPNHQGDPSEQRPLCLSSNSIPELWPAVPAEPLRSYLRPSVFDYNLMRRPVKSRVTRRSSALFRDFFTCKRRINTSR